MLLTEVFHSIQGEGPHTGIPMFFVRTNRCNLRCSWCDSTYTFDNGYEIPLDELLEQVEQTWEDWICLTGGEPLLQPEALEFVKKVTSMGKSVLIETGGSLPVREFCSVPGTVIDMDVKTPSSGEEKRTLPSNLGHLRKDDYIKFVISDEADYRFAISFISENRYSGTCVFQPSYGSDARWLAERMLQDRIHSRFMVQMHKQLWGEERGK